ncbi:hypothetical protein GCK32_022446 [Trichostrongylus colubriformis]|uniref:Uncharacterized protein n=1 Tax=Trichostrongylus colubriformis TaxID=6319 RepID=A0AAN8FBH2_TRICO
MALLRSNSLIDGIITCLQNLDEALSRSLVGPPVIRNLLFTIEYTVGYLS